MESKTPILEICGLNEVCNKITEDFTFLISILSSDDVLIRPSCISPDNHLVLFFEDIADPKLAFGQFYAPSKNDIKKLINFGNQISNAQLNSLTRLKTLLHCSRGLSRSPAAAFILLCSWYGKGEEKFALSEVLKIQPFAIPNTLMVRYGDELLARNGEMNNAIKLYK